MFRNEQDVEQKKCSNAEYIVLIQYLQDTGTATHRGGGQSDRKVLQWAFHSLLENVEIHQIINKVLCISTVLIQQI